MSRGEYNHERPHEVLGIKWHRRTRLARRSPTRARTHLPTPPPRHKRGIDDVVRRVLTPRDALTAGYLRSTAAVTPTRASPNAVTQAVAHDATDDGRRHDDVTDSVTGRPPPPPRTRGRRHERRHHRGTRLRRHRHDTGAVMTTPSFAYVRLADVTGGIRNS